MNDFNVPMLVNSTGLVYQDQCEDRNTDKPVMAPRRDTEARSGW